MSEQDELAYLRCPNCGDAWICKLEDVQAPGSRCGKCRCGGAADRLATGGDRAELKARGDALTTGQAG